MNKNKPNDILVATINNPSVTAYDLLSNNILGDNTSLRTKEEYKDTKFIKNAFTRDGKFDEVAFDNMYKLASDKYSELTNEQYIESLDELQYNPFDITRPKDAKTYSVGSFYSKEINPFKISKGWTGVNSVGESPFSFREIAQQSKVYDRETDTWSEESLNDLSIKDKLFGETLVYAQYDDDGEHEDLESGYMVKHKKGDWIVNEKGNIFTEKLGKREIYGKQVVNPSDIMTTDGSLFDKFNFFDSDDREKSIAGTTFKLAAQIAPYVIPGFNAVYGGVTAAVNLAAVLPTFYKAFEGMLMGDTKTKTSRLATAGEGYLSKFVQTSISDESQDSLFNYEQLGQLVTSVFAQIYQQRAAATLATIVKSPKNQVFDKKLKELLDEPSRHFITNALKSQGKLDENELSKIYAAMADKIPGMKELRQQQSHMAKAFNLGYMALVTSADIYGEAIEGGYDRRTAGFATIAAAAGQYGIMMNNEMGTWFLDKTTGYDLNTNKALMRKSVKEFLNPIEKSFTIKSKEGQKQALGQVFKNIKTKIDDIFLNPSELGENLFKHSIIEGVEEVTEQLVLDATKGAIDVFSYLGFTKNKGSFGGFDNVFSKQGLENYLANLVGGMIGGPLFEYNTARIEPKIKSLFKENIIQPEVKTSIYQLIGNGQSAQVIEEINKQRKFFGNNFIAPASVEGEVKPEEKTGKSEADVIADNAIGIIKIVEGIMNSNGIVNTNEEIIKKAFIDHQIIKDLEKAKGDFPVGVEGLILTDYTKNLNKLVEKNLEILELQKTATEIVDNKESIKRIKEEASIYKNNINDILEGKKAQHYFDRAVTYFNKDLLNSFVAIDRDSYVKIKYKKSYYDMPETGIGFTKERVNKEWKEYKDSGDIVKDLEVAVKAILNLEQLSNESIAKFSESGYDIQRIKSGKDFLNMIATTTLFNTKEDTPASYKQFIQMAKDLERSTGKKVLPWDVITTNFFDHLVSNNFIIDKNTNATITPELLDQQIDVNGKKISKKEIIKDTVDSILQFMPADNIDVSIFADYFNSEIDKLNEGANLELDQLKIDKNILLTTLDSKIGDEKIEDEAKIKELEAKIKFKEESKFNVEILPEFKFTKNQKTKLEIIEQDFDLQIKATNLTQEHEFLKSLEESGYDSKKVLNDITQIITEKVDGKKKKAKIIISEVENYLVSNNVYNKEILSAVINAPTGTITNKITQVLTTLKNDTSAFDKYNSIAESSKKSRNLIEIEKSSLETTDHLFHALMKEFKDGNRDGELLELLKQTYKNSLYTLSSVDTSKTFKSEELLELLKITSKDLTIVEELSEKVHNFIEVRDDEFSGEDSELLWQNIQTTINSISSDPLKNKIQLNIKKDSEFYYSLETFENIRKVVDNVLKFKISNKADVEVLMKSDEMFLKTNEFISNSIYDFIKEFSVSLNNDSNPQTIKLFDILKNEEYSLYKSSDASTYLSDGVNIGIIQQALNELSMLKSVVNGVSTTTIDINNPHGFIALRQQFAKTNDTKSDVLKLKTINSDTATLINNDIERLENKLGFLKVLLLGNSGKIFEEQEQIRVKTNDLIIKAWQDITKLNIKLAGSPIIDDLDSILRDSKLSAEQKLMNLGISFYEKHKNTTLEEKKSFVRDLKKALPYNNDAIDIYSKNGSNIINKDIKELSNNDFILYLTSNLVVNSRDFNIRLKELLEGEFDKSPFFTQEIAAQIAYASIVNSELFEELALSTNENLIPTEKITYLLGNSGTGKTTVGFKLLISLLKNNNSNLKLWFAAPHTKQSIKLDKEALSNIDSKSFDKNTFNKLELFRALGVENLYDYINNPSNKVIVNGKYASINKDAYKDITISNTLPNILFIDEITHFGAHELYLLNEVSKKALENGKIFKIVGAGDISQDGYEYNTMSFNVDYVSGTFAPRLSLTVRALNSQKRKNNDFLSSVANTTRQLWQSTEDDKLILDIIKDGVPLSVYKNTDTLNGDLLVEGNTIPENVLNILSNIIKKDGTTKIAILNDTINLEDSLLNLLNKYEIKDSNYEVYTPENIQGAEADYFIFNTSLINPESSLASKIRKLNTYATRPKHATIIINDAPQNLPFTLIQKIDDYAKFIDPLTEEVVKENKVVRIKALTDLLGDDLKIKYDYFKFEPEKISEENPEVETGISVEPTTLKVDEKLPEFLESDLATSDIVKIQDSYMLHTFYNDLNATKITHIIEGKVELQRKEGSFYGLNTGKVSEEGLIKIINDYVRLKNDILLKGGHDKEFTINGHTIRGISKGEFVIRKSFYDPDYNTPYGKLYGNTEKQLQRGQVFVNLFYKVKNVEDNFEYIHLATFPKLTTLETNIKEGVESTLYKNYSAFISGNLQELTVNKDAFKIHTSTRLVSHEKAKTNRKEFTIKEISKIPGIRFFNINKNQFQHKPEIALFPNRNSPTAFSDFVNTYRKTLFGRDLTNDQLRKMFNMYAGKAYIVVSFMDQGINKGNDRNSQLQIVHLKSKQRPLKEVIEIIHKFRRSKDTDKKNKEYAEIKSLFSGSQVLDLLILLAEKRPELYIKLFEPTKDIIEAQKNWDSFNNNSIAKAMLEEYGVALAKTAQDIGKDSVIDKMAYANESLKHVYLTILNNVKDAQKTGKVINTKTLKESLVQKIKINKNTAWFHDFWHLFQIQNIYSNLSERDGILDELKSFGKVVSDTLNEIANFFEGELENAGEFVTGIYYNIPISGKPGSGKNLMLSTHAEDLNMKYLYTDLAIESPYLLINTDFIPNSTTEIKIDSKNEFIQEIENTKNSETNLEEASKVKVQIKPKSESEIVPEIKRKRINKKIKIETTGDPLIDFSNIVKTHPLYSNIFKPVDESIESWQTLQNNLEITEKLISNYNSEDGDSMIKLFKHLSLISSTTDSKNLFTEWANTLAEQWNSILAELDNDKWAYSFFADLHSKGFKNFYNIIKQAGNTEGNFLENLKDLLLDSLNTSDGKEIGKYMKFLDYKLIKNCD